MNIFWMAAPGSRAEPPQNRARPAAAASPGRESGRVGAQGLFASMLHDILNRRALECERRGAPPDRIVQCAAAA